MRRDSCQRILERPEHQRERRAELVADVGEERGLGAIDLGQRFARLRSSSQARALAIAVPIWLAIKSKKSRYNSSSVRCALTPATIKPASSLALFERIGTTTALCGGSAQGPGGDNFEACA